MNPFTTPDRLFISRRPQDMRAGIQRLASVVTTDFSMDPTDGALYCFVSRDCLKMKLLRFETIIPKYCPWLCHPHRRRWQSIGPWFLRDNCLAHNASRTSVNPTRWEDQHVEVRHHWRTGPSSRQSKP